MRGDESREIFRCYICMVFKWRALIAYLTMGEERQIFARQQSKSQIKSWSPISFSKSACWGASFCRVTRVSSPLIGKHEHPDWMQCEHYLFAHPEQWKTRLPYSTLHACQLPQIHDLLERSFRNGTNGNSDSKLSSNWLNFILFFWLLAWKSYRGRDV